MVFIHPDLGLGGAERLVIDAALSLQSLSHSTTIFTPFLQPSRCFSEVRPPNSIVPVKVVKPVLPRSLFGRFHAILAALRCTFVALYVCLFCKFDVAIVDIVSLPILVFALFRKPVLFYCHYPDKLLAHTLNPGVKASPLKRFYRNVVDFAEQFALRYASSVCCNSQFTARMFTVAFPKLRQPAVIYPCIAMPDAPRRNPRNILLSINRYERKKAVSLAVETLGVLHDRHADIASDIKLVIAGGYDMRVAENVEYFNELKQLVHARKLDDHVEFMKNITEDDRRKLFSEAMALLYTPTNEHFGIVPLEAMAHKLPVIAVSSGGPKESVVHEETGMLCESSAKAFSDAVVSLLKTPEKGATMGEAGRTRVDEMFSRKVLGTELQNVLSRIADVL